MFALAGLLAATGCMTGQQRAAISAAAHRPAPANPDLSGVMERYYQGVENERWTLVYGMLSDRYRRQLGRSALQERYAPYTDFDINARQTSNHTVVATIDAVRRDDRSQHVTIVETATLSWDGDHWVIEELRETR